MDAADDKTFSQGRDRMVEWQKTQSPGQLSPPECVSSGPCIAAEFDPFGVRGGRKESSVLGIRN